MRRPRSPASGEESAPRDGDPERGARATSRAVIRETFPEGVPRFRSAVAILPAPAPAFDPPAPVAPPPAQGARAPRRRNPRYGGGNAMTIASLMPPVGSCRAPAPPRPPACAIRWPRERAAYGLLR